MSLTIFEARQRTKDLIDKATQLWKDSIHSDQLADIQDDPVFKMLFAALAYQSSQLENEINRLKSDVLNDLTDYLTPNRGIMPMPATIALATNLINDVPEMELNAYTPFQIMPSGIEFVPLLKTKVINIRETDIERLDGRRWKVTLSLADAITSLTGFAFALKHCDFKGLQVSFNGRPLPLVRPWQFSELPFSEFFSIDNMLFNRRYTYDPTAVCMDLFARQNVTHFVLGESDLSQSKPYGEDTIVLTFEFFGIDSDFVFDHKHLLTNALILANATKQSRTLDAENPIVKLGYDRPSEDSRTSVQYFMHLLASSNIDDADLDNVIVRTYATERFNSKSLLDLTNVLLAKIDTDAPAFAAFTNRRTSESFQLLRNIVADIKDTTESIDAGKHFSGVYAALRNPQEMQAEHKSIQIDYVTTLGAEANYALSNNAKFNLPGALNPDATTLIADPVPGINPQNTPEKLANLSKYLFMTADRLVTPADIKMFCLTVLQTQQGLDKNLISNINIGHRPINNDHMIGYEVVVDIYIRNNAYVKKMLASNVTRIEKMLEKMIQVRSTNIYPVTVNIILNKE